LALAYEHWASQWDDFRMELQELIHAGNDVVMVTRHYGKGRASGAAVQAVVAYVWTVDDGQLVRFGIFNTKAQALKPWVAASRWPHRHQDHCCYRDLGFTRPPSSSPSRSPRSGVPHFVNWFMHTS
jgi:hypothetical protein